MLNPRAFFWVFGGWALVAGMPGVAAQEVISNPATPANGSTVLRLAKLWSLGGESDADEEFFGVISDVAVATNGDVHLLDAQLHEVRVFDADGGYLRTFGREGEGPGEFRNPRNLVLLSDGSVGVVQPRPAAVVRFTPEGESAGTLSLPNAEDGGFMFIDEARSRAGHLMVSGMNMQFREGSRSRTSRLMAVGPDGSLGAEFLRRESEMNMARIVIDETDFTQAWSLAPDGRVVYRDGFDYRFTTYAPDGSIDRMVERESEPLVRSDAEKKARSEELSRRMRFRGRGRGPGRDLEVHVEVSDVEPAIRWFAHHDDGSLWVLGNRSFRNRKQGELGTFDVFDLDGRFVRTVTLLGDGDFEEDRILLAGERIFVITQFRSSMAAMAGNASEEEEPDDDDLVPMEVICYGVDWGKVAGR
jgi:hypothetical protein